MADKKVREPEEFVVGTIESIEHKTATNGDSYWLVTANGEKMSIWDAPLLTKAVVGATVRLGVTHNGKYTNIVSVDNLGGVPVEKMAEATKAAVEAGPPVRAAGGGEAEKSASIERMKALAEANILLNNLMVAGMVIPNSFDDAVDLVISIAKDFYSRVLKG